MKRQGGVTIIELILVIGLMSVITLLSFYDRQLDLEQAKARQVGGILFQYNNAVRSALAQGAVTSNIRLNGTDWLKNNSCGGDHAVGAEFLSCDFPAATVDDPIKFGRLSLSTAISVTGTAPNRKVIATTITSPFSLIDRVGAPKVRADLAGLASISAASALGSGYKSAGVDGFSPYTAVTDSSYKSDPLSARITVVASNNANNDVWLRTDGGNKMRSAIVFEGVDPEDRKIFGASGIENFTGQVLKIGSGSGLLATSNSGVVIDSGAEILGDFRVRKSLHVETMLSVNGDIDATGTITAEGNITSNKAVAAKIFYDADDNAFFLDPSQESILNDLTANTIASKGRLKTDEYLELVAVAVAGAICPQNGLVSRDSSGSLLSCKNGKWGASGASAYGVGTGFMTGGAAHFYVNSITGNASCPAGLVPNLIGGVQIGGCQPCLTYSCSLPK